MCTWDRAIFKRELKNGILWQLYVADQFRRRGMEVETPEYSFEPCNVEDIATYIQSKDLMVNGRIIEVKGRNVDFTTPSSFPYSTIFIDTKDGYDKKDPKPVLYACVSTETGSIVTLDTADTFERWGVCRTFDKVRNIKLVAYECDRGLWKTFDDGIRRLATETG
jgi:hypothetical protein